MTRDEVQNKINICENVLQQYDYAARKVAFEVAKKLKELHPDLDMPIYEQYKEVEAEANNIRAQINELREQLNNAAE